MSDVLIKNIEMPKETQCCYTIFPNGKVIVHWDGKVLGEATAIELPPHGRLVNLDDVYEAINREIVPKGILLSDFYKAFADIPVVLEAST